MSENPQEIGFILGALAGFLLHVFLGDRTAGRAAGYYILFVMMITGVIGWLIGSLFRVVTL